MKKALKNKRIKDVKVSSRGIFAKKEDINPNAISVLKKLNVSSSNRKSIKLGKIQKDTLYVVMTEEMRPYVKAEKVLTMKQLLGYDVLDPYGQAEEVYMQTALQLQQANKIIIENIKMWREK